MQVLFEEEEFERIQDAARTRGMTVAEWVRQALRAARREEPTGDVDRKLAVIRAAARHAFPAPDIEQMLDEIEKGYSGRPAE